MSEHVVFVPEQLHPQAVSRIADLATVETDVASAGEAEYAIVRNYRVDQALLDRMPALRLVIKHGAGLDRIDVSLLDERGVRWLATPGMNANGVAELAILQAMQLLRGIGLDETTVTARELANRQVAVLGFGRVGSSICRILARGFGAEVRAYDPYVSSVSADAALVDQLEDAVDSADVLFVTCPLTPETTDLVDTRVLDHLKEHAVVVNTARPPIVNNDAIARKLESGKIRGYAHDFQGEPGAFQASPARGMVTSTHHVGGATEEALLRTGAEVVRLLDIELRGEAS